MKAFNGIYETVATEYQVPTGKNRHHKFKDKIVELWNAMEQEVECGRQDSTTHPLYQLGIKQLHTYRAASSSRKKRLNPDGSDEEDDEGKESLCGGVSPNRRGGSPVSGKKSRTAKTLKSNGAFTGTLDLTAGDVPGALQALIRTCDRGFSRAEHLALQQLPPKLPSPLNELHRVYLQLISSDTAIRAAGGNASTGHTSASLRMIEPYYNEAIGAYLAQVTRQANNSTNSHPVMLGSALEGLDLLLRHHCVHDPNGTLTASLNFTYKHVLQAYLKQLYPRFPAPAEAEAGGPRGSSRREDGNDGKEEGAVAAKDV